MNLFLDEPVFILASGPSLTEDDIKAVSGFKTVAVNTTWEKARDCDVIFAGDHKWWMTNGKSIDIPARRYGMSYNSERQYSVKRFKSKIARNKGYNSGCIAIEFAIAQGASKVVMLGFDCSVKYGTHHHGDHKKSPNPNPARCHMWKKQFSEIPKIYPDADVVNCSRYTELKMFPRRHLEDVLCELGST